MIGGNNSILSSDLWVRAPGDGQINFKVSYFQQCGDTGRILNFA